MSVYIAPIGDGLGDAILSLPAVQALIAAGEPTHLVLRSPRQVGIETLVPGLAGYVREVDFDQAKLASTDRYVNLRAHPLQTDHVWGSPAFEARYPGYRIADILAGICADFQIDADFCKLIALPFKRRQDVRDKVILLPGSAGAFKCWTTEGWFQLIRHLERKGLPVAIVGQPEHSLAVAALVDMGIELVHTPSLVDALDVLSSARMVISVDTGLMHLALQQGVPVVGIWVNHPAFLSYRRDLPHCFPVITVACQSECVEKEMAKNFNEITAWHEWRSYESWDCPAGARRCMNQLEFNAVLLAVEKALNCQAESCR